MHLQDFCWASQCRELRNINLILPFASWQNRHLHLLIVHTSVATSKVNRIPSFFVFVCLFFSGCDHHEILALCPGIQFPAGQAESLNPPDHQRTPHHLNSSIKICYIV